MPKAQKSSSENAWDPGGEKEMQNIKREGRGDKGITGAQGELSPLQVISSLLPIPTELLNVCFERMGDKGLVLAASSV